MGKIVVELQKDIIEKRLDDISILRKAKLIASKLDLIEFEKWINFELKGYEKYNDIPEYRKVFGEIKAYNPCYGLIPVVMSSEISKKLNNRKLFNSIGELISLSKCNDMIKIALTSEISEALSDDDVTFPCYFVFSKNSILGIIENIKNYLLEWCLKLEKDGILGDDFEFNESEKEKAKQVSQQVNYYGTVVTGNFNNSLINSYNNNVIDTIDFLTLIDEIKKSLKNEKIEEEDKNDALEILEDIDNSLKVNKKASIIKSAFNGLKEFLINVGASVTATIIANHINHY